MVLFSRCGAGLLLLFGISIGKMCFIFAALVPAVMFQIARLVLE